MVKEWAMRTGQNSLIKVFSLPQGLFVFKMTNEEVCGDALEGGLNMWEGNLWCWKSGF